MNRALRNIDREFGPLASAAESAGDKDKYEDIMSEWTHEAQEYRDELEFFETNRVRKVADHLGIALPPKPTDASQDENWEYSYDLKKWLLTPETRRHLRKMILQDRKEIRDYWVGWAPVISALIGLIGVTIGLATVLSSCGASS